MKLNFRKFDLPSIFVLKLCSKKKAIYNKNSFNRKTLVMTYCPVIAVIGNYSNETRVSLGGLGWGWKQWNKCITWWRVFHIEKRVIFRDTVHHTIYAKVRLERVSEFYIWEAFDICLMGDLSSLWVCINHGDWFLGIVRMN